MLWVCYCESDLLSFLFACVTVYNMFGVLSLFIWPKEELSQMRYWPMGINNRQSENKFKCSPTPPVAHPQCLASTPPAGQAIVNSQCNCHSVLPPFAENPSRDHGAGLRQDWQERRHWEDPGGQQGHRGRAQTLVRHAGQPPPPHRPVASTTAGGGGGRRRRSHNCQEVKLPPTLPGPQKTHRSLPLPHPPLPPPPVHHPPFHPHIARPPPGVPHVSVYS